MAVSTIEQRRAALFTALAENGRGTLLADRSDYPASTVAGGVIATLTQPFGVGTAFEVIGPAAAQLALGASGRIVAGAGVASAGGKYEIKVRATSPDGRRSVTETLAFAATVTGIIPANALTDPLFAGEYVTDSLFNNDYVTGA